MDTFLAQAKVRMYDTDAAGILYFANQFRFVQDAFEAFLELGGFPFGRLFHTTDILFVVVSAQATYTAPLFIGDTVDIALNISHIGTTSFSVLYTLTKEGVPVGDAKMTHVCIGRSSREKQSLPETTRVFLSKYLKDDD